MTLHDLFTSSRNLPQRSPALPAEAGEGWEPRDRYDPSPLDAFVARRPEVTLQSLYRPSA